MAAGQINIDINVSTQQAQSALNQLLQSSQKWGAAMSKKLTANVDLVFPDMSEVARQFDKYQKAFRSQVKKMGGDAWDFQFYTDKGHEQKEADYRRMFKDLQSNKLDQASALNYLKQLQELKSRLQKGTAVSFGSFGAAETKQLDDLIGKLEKATSAFKNLQRAKSKHDTIQTSVSANKAAADAAREIRNAERIANAQKRIADIERQRRDNQRTEPDSSARLQKEIRLLQIKLALQRQIDLIANNGKASRATLATEVELNKQQRLNRILSEQGGILGNLKSLAKQYLSIYAVWNFGDKIVKTTGYFEQQRVALEGIIGSASEAEKAFTRMQHMALQSPFELKEIVGQTKQAAAYGIGDGNTDKLLDEVKMLGDLSAGLGVDMSRLILAYGQVKSAAVLRGQELRQFTEAGIPMVQALADKFTQLNGKLVTTGEVFELISKRQVSFEMVASVLRDMTAEGGKFYNMQEQITETLYGQVQKLKDIWTQELNNLGSGNSGMLMGIVKAIQSLVKNMRGISMAGGIIAAVAAYKKLRIAAMQAAQGTGAVARSFRLAKREVEIFSYQIDHSQMKLKGLRKAMVVAGAASRAFGSILSSLAGGIATLAISALLGAITQYIHAKRELGKKLSEVDASFSKDIAKMQTGFDNLASKIRTFSYDTKAYNEAMDALKANYGDYISTSLLQRIDEEKQGIRELTISWEALTKAVHAAIEEQKNFEKSKTYIETTGSYVGEKLKEGGLLGAGSLKAELSAGSSLMTAYYRSKPNLKGFNGQDAEKYILQAFDSYSANRGRTKEDFMSALSGVNISDQNIKDFLSTDWVIDDLFKKITSTSGYKEYTTAIADYESSPLYKLDKTFEDAEARAQKAKVGRYNDNPEEYNPINWDKNRQVEYLKGIRDLVQDQDFYGNIQDEELKKKFDEAFSFNKGVDDEGNEIDVIKDLGQTKRAADVIKELIDSLGESDPTRVARLNNVLDGLVEKIGTLSGTAEEVANKIDVELNKAGTEEKEKFYKTYLPTNETYQQKENNVRDDREKVKKWLKDHALWEHDNGAQGEEYKKNKTQEAWLDDLFFNKFKLTEDTKKGGAGAKPRFTNFIADMLKVITDADREVKNIAQTTGYTGAMTDFVNEKLSEDNTVRKFFTSGSNPFEEIFAKMSDYGIDTKMVKGLDKNILTTILKEVGWEEGKTMSLPDFKAMYEKLIKNISEKVVPNIQDERTRTDVEKYLGDALFRSPFNVNEVEEALKAMQQSLSNIEKMAEIEAKKRSDYEQLRDAGGAREAYRAIYGAGWSHYDPRTQAQNTLKDLLNIGDVNGEGGNGIYSTLVGEDLSKMLQDGQTLNIGNLQMLYSAKKRIEEQRNALLKSAEAGDEDAGKQVEQFTNVAKQFEKAIDDMVKSIIKAYKNIPRSEIEKTNVILENFFETFRQNIATIEKEGGRKMGERKIDETKRFYDNVAKQLGGTGNMDFVKAGTEMGHGKQNALGALSGKMNFQQILGNNFADKYQAAVEAGDMKGAKDIAGMANGAGATLAMIDAIIKAVYGAIKAIGEMIKATQKVKKSFNKASASVDKYGNTQYTKMFDEHKMEQIERGTDIAMTYNQHVMDGWEKFKGGDFLGAIGEIYTSITDMIADINAYLDADVRDEIEKLVEANKSLEKTIDKKEWTIKYSSGIDTFNQQGSIISDYWEMYKNAKAAYEKELNETKATDTDALDDYEKQMDNARKAAIDKIKEIKDEVFGTADALSSTLTDAFVNAFKNATNATRDWAAAAKEYIGGVLQSMLLEKVLAPQLDAVIDRWMGGSEEEIAERFKDSEGKIDDKALGEYYRSRLADEDAGKQAQQEIYALGDWMTDYYNSLGQWTKDMIAFNADTSSLSGGIQGMTEDTGRTLEGLGNSILFQHVQTNQKLDQVIALPFAQVQMSWFKDVQQQTQMIASATQSLRDAVENVRNGIRPFHVTMD